MLVRLGVGRRRGRVSFDGAGLRGAAWSWTSARKSELRWLIDGVVGSVVLVFVVRFGVGHRRGRVSFDG